MEATFWALISPILAIIISSITKEVNLSLIFWNSCKMWSLLQF